MTARLILILVAIAMGCTHGVAQADHPPLLPADYNRTELLGHIRERALSEISGIASSRLRDDILWMHNDSGHKPHIFAVDKQGKLWARFHIDDATNVDWEDMASFSLDGTSWLLIADVGDNTSRRNECHIYIIKEPTLPEQPTDKLLTAPIAWRLTFTWEDGPRDCESVAVDVSENRIYLLSKRDTPPVLYSLPLRPDDAATPLVATREREVTFLAASFAAEGHPPIPPLHPFTLQPTAMDFADDGGAAVIVTYLHGYLIERLKGQSWSDAFAGGAATWISLPIMRQREAVCFGVSSRTLYTTSEQLPAPLYRLTIAPDEAPAAPIPTD